MRDFKLPSGCFAGDGERAVATAREYLVSFDLRGIHPFPNRHRRHYFAVVHTHRDEFLWASTTNDEKPLFCVHRHPHWNAARRYRPSRNHLASLQIDDGHEIPVLQVDVDLARPIRCEELRSAVKIDHWLDFVVRQIEVRLEAHQDTLVPGDRQNQVESAIVDDSVDVGLRSHLPRIA